MFSNDFHSSSHLVVVKNNTAKRFFFVEEFYHVKMAGGQDLVLGIGNPYRKDSKTVVWQLLSHSSESNVVFDCLDITGNFLLFEGTRQLMITVEIK